MNTLKSKHISRKDNHLDDAIYERNYVVKVFKDGSARMFSEKHPEIKQQKFWGGHLCSHSYYMSTLGNMSKELVERYIDNQRTTANKNAFRR